MAATLKGTGFDKAVGHKVTQALTIDSAAVLKNVTGGPGTLRSVLFDSAKSSASLYLHLFDGKDTSAAQIVFRGLAGSSRSLTFPDGWAFNELSLWVSGAPGETDTTSFSGTVTAALVCS